MKTEGTVRIAPGLFPMISALYMALITGLPILAIAVTIMALPAPWNIIALVPAPAVGLLLYVAVAGILSIPHQRAIVAGKFRRDVGTSLYFHRRLFGLCWTMVYYCSPAYHAALAFAATRKMLFRLFGYRGETSFTIYPDTWIRDLPLLSFGENAYISNRATLGTNIVLNNGKILVGPVTVAANSVVGHLAAVGPGTEIGSKSEIGVGAILGVGVRVGSSVTIGGAARIDHMAIIGDRTFVGQCAFIGRNSVIGSGLRVPAGTFIPVGTRLQTQQDIDALAASTAPATGSRLDSVCGATLPTVTEHSFGRKVSR